MHPVTTPAASVAKVNGTQPGQPIACRCHSPTVDDKTTTFRQPEDIPMRTRKPCVPCGFREMLFRPDYRLTRAGELAKTARRTTTRSPAVAMWPGRPRPGVPFAARRPQPSLSPEHAKLCPVPSTEYLPGNPCQKTRQPSRIAIIPDIKSPEFDCLKCNIANVLAASALSAAVIAANSWHVS